MAHYEACDGVSGIINVVDTMQHRMLVLAASIIILRFI